MQSTHLSIKVYKSRALTFSHNHKLYKRLCFGKNNIITLLHLENVQIIQNEPETMSDWFSNSYTDQNWQDSSRTFILGVRKLLLEQDTLAFSMLCESTSCTVIAFMQGSLAPWSYDMLYGLPPCSVIMKSTSTAFIQLHHDIFNTPTSSSWPVPLYVIEQQWKWDYSLSFFWITRKYFAEIKFSDFARYEVSTLFIFHGS